MSRSSKCSVVYEPIKKLSGGYRPMTNRQICEAWDAYISKALNGFPGFRVYLALHEIDERPLAFNRRRRRLGLPPRRFALDEDWLVDEVHALVGGVGGRHIRAVFRRLEAAGLVRFSPSGIEFPSPDPDPLPASTRVAAMLERIDARKSVRERVVPIPRKVVRHIARGVPPVVAATMLGHAMRCLWLHRYRIRATGSCSASFVADLFHVHPRTVKRARAHLRELGWLQSIETGWRHTRRHGPKAEVNLEWRDERQPTSQYVPRCTESPPHRPPVDTESPPLRTERSLLSDPDQQKPPKKCRNCVTKTVATQLPATLSHVILEDLSDPFRIDELFQQAVRRGWVAATACERLHFHTAAAHALSAVAARNPCGLFVYLVRGHRWDRLTLAAEDRARRSIQSLDEPDCSRGERRSAASTLPRLPSPPPTKRTRPERRCSQLVRFVATQKSLDTAIERTSARTDAALAGVARMLNPVPFATATHDVLPRSWHTDVSRSGADPTPTQWRLGPAARDPVGRRSSRPSDSELATADRVCRWPGLKIT